ncbi:MAG: hypothetical protein QM784_09760 [Polyangiaceae bacterium]
MQSKSRGGVASPSLVCVTPEPGRVPSAWSGRQIDTTELQHLEVSLTVEIAKEAQGAEGNVDTRAAC